MASDNRADLRKMKSRIEQLEKAALELNTLSGGVPVVEKNTRTILAATRLLKFGISDVAEIETQSRRTAMGEVKKIKTVCRSCHGGCGVIAHVQDGKVIKVDGNPDSPISHGTLCSKGLAITQLAYHPDRILHPMKKTAGGWQRITWDEALDTIAGKFKAVIRDYGPESIVVGQGTGRDYESHLYRFANQLGTPNVLTAGHMCYVSRVASTLVTVGNLPVCDYAGGPKCIVMWGCNPQWTNPDEYKGASFWTAYKKGAKLICIDPRRGFLAKKADLWLQLRPGTDAALAMGFHSVIIEEELYDKEFTQNHINGWDAFRERVKDYPLERVQEITWVDRALIRRAARLYAQTKPACIHWGVPTEQNNNCADCTRIMTGLMAATGNLDAPGGNVLFVNPPTRTVAEFSRHKDLTPAQRAKRLGGDQFKLGARVAFINPKKAWDAILEEKPYPLKAGLLCGSNPVITRANAREAYAALKKLEFLVVIDFFLTPTAELADIFLPAGTWLEQNHVADNWKRHGYALARQKCVEIGECRAGSQDFPGTRQTHGPGLVGHGGRCPRLPARTGRTDLGAVQGGRIFERRNGLSQIPGKGLFHSDRKSRALFNRIGEVGIRSPAQVHGNSGEPGIKTRVGEKVPVYSQCRLPHPLLFPLRQPGTTLVAGDPP